MVCVTRLIPVIFRFERSLNLFDCNAKYCSGVLEALAHLVMHHATFGDYALGLGLLMIASLWVGYCLCSVYLLAKVLPQPIHYSFSFLFFCFFDVAV